MSLPLFIAKLIVLRLVVDVNGIMASLAFS